MDAAALTLAAASRLLAKGELSSLELTQAVLHRIKTLNPRLNAFISVDEEGALAAARQADEQRRQGETTPLTGLPIALKDIFCTRQQKTTCGSRMLANFQPPYDATVTRKLQQAGAVIVGKTNMDEFAMGSSNETSWFGPVKNPWDLTRTPGGSSGGSAAAVAADLCLAAIGTDTGGSIRQPASLCGISGLKPTYGRVSRFGMIAFASSLDQGGPMTKSVEDAAILLQAMAGHDAADATSIPQPVPDYPALLQQSVSGMRLGIPAEYFTDGMQPEVQQAVDAAIQIFHSLGITTVPVSLPHTSYAVPTYYIIASAEASSNLARYDGVRFSHRCQEAKDLADLYFRSRAEGFGAEVKRRIMLGTYVLSSGYYDAYYRKAQKVRRLIADDFDAAFRQVDAVLTPTSPTTAFRIGERTDDPVQMYLSDIFTIGVNLAGLPALSLPCGRDQAGLPIGMQLIGPPLGESPVLQLGHAFQQATDWHHSKPVIVE
ncbi:MAG: Asp-tRNA(Asn)/Glu-tRNA(Gln) amidotransferase subunit GatA [Magnetococcales bacterium]|nr:Asp-tRNA(Asn)/Glu-tRNA(Gln) amidotransferase subunit GatA [Magnetococcales bacterium]NGZ25350.1 Asp-tRNA(Asn)/Glu-tRNA(Gln) amidotransferase subunit GatA [Magnetococcales bacterium]